jgi:hypothetical protein
VTDSSTYILIQANINGGSNQDFIESYDVSVNRLKKGEAGINVDMSVIQDRVNIQPIKISNVIISKSE